MVSSQHTTLSAGIITIVAVYVLWSFMQTGTFLPYTTVGTPNIQSISIAILLLAVIFGGAGTILLFVGSWLFSLAKKVDKIPSALGLGIVGLTLFFSASLLLLLHVFQIIPWTVTMLSYAVFWSIVVYGKYKERTRFKKYITESHRSREGKNPLEIRDK